MTKRMEQEVARAMFGRTRISSDMPTRKKKERPKTMLLQAFIGGQWQDKQVAPEDYPAFYTAMPLYYPPGILYGLPPIERPSCYDYVMILPQIPDNEKRIARLQERFGTDLLQAPYKRRAWEFSLMLAKIAHGVTFMKFGNRFEPLLPPIIRLLDARIGYFIGTSLQPLPPHPAQSNYLYWYRTLIAGTKTEPLLTMKFRFFGDIAPTYTVVVGKITPEFAQENLGESYKELR